MNPLSPSVAPAGVDMSPAAITRRLQRVSDLVWVCRALAGPRYRARPQDHVIQASSATPLTATNIQAG